MDDLAVDELEQPKGTAGEASPATRAPLPRGNSSKSKRSSIFGFNKIGASLRNLPLFSTGSQNTASVNPAPDEASGAGSSLDEMLKAARPKALTHQVQNFMLDDDDDSRSPDDASKDTNRQKSVMMEIYKNENLGEDFLETSWVPPSIRLAKEYRKENIFKGGNAPLTSVKMTEAYEVGSGLPLYFQFIKSMAIAFFIMSLLSIPSLLIYSSGTNIGQESQDIVGFYRLSLGNFGYHPNDNDYLEKITCHHDIIGLYENETCLTIHIGNNDIEITQADAGLIITTFEFLQICVFFLTVFYLSYKHYRLTESAFDSNCTISRYTVMVKNIPPKTKYEELVAHFSNLYQLEKTDFRQRPPLFGSTPVQNTENSHDSKYENTWIAEATVFTKIGQLIRVYRNDVKLQEKLFRSRAQMKMYSEGTTHAGGFNYKRYSRAQFTMLETARQIETNTHVLLNHYRLSDEARKAGHNQVGPDDMSGGNLFRADGICATVTFQYSESMARCVEDYVRYHAFPWSLFYPEKLKFKGRKIKVFRAPEPDEIIWENLEISSSEKRFYRVLNGIFSLILLIIGFMIILQAAVYHVRFADELPDFSLCELEIPSLFKSSYQLPDGIIELTRHPENYTGLTMNQKDEMCDNILPGSFYAVYTVGGNISNSLGTYDISRCSPQSYASALNLPITSLPSNQYGECPHFNQSAFCPCMSLQGEEKCQTLSCNEPSVLSTSGCSVFPSRDVAGCYCYQNIRDVFYSLLSSTTPFSGHLAVCSTFFTNYVSAFGLTYASSLATVVINSALKYFFVFTSKNEFHNSNDQESGSMLYKIFLVIYLNMAFVVLCAYGLLVNSPDDLKPTYILQGQYVDYSPEWYGQVGAYLCFTLLLNSPVPYIFNIPEYLIFKPFRRWRLYRDIDKRNQRDLAMQHDVNMLEVGPVFEYTANSAFLVAMLFFAMTYAPGLPIVMPLIAGMFILYFIVDKILVLRFFRKSSHMSGGVNKMILKLLPYAAIIRMCNACWMYGNANIIPSATIQLAFLPGFGGNANPASASKAYTEYLSENNHGLGFYAVSRIVRSNVLPIFILLCIVVIIMILRLLWRELPFYWIIKLLSYIGRMCCRNKQLFDVIKSDGYVHGPDLLQLRDANRMEMAPFTEPYFKYVRKVGAGNSLFSCFDMSMYISEIEKKEGWDVSVSTAENYEIKVKRWTKGVSRAGENYRAKGSQKCTYEVVADTGVMSYHLEKIPDYRLAINGLKEGAKNLRSSMTKNTNGVEAIMGSVAKRFTDKENQKHTNVLAQKSKAAHDAEEASKESKKKREEIERDEYKPTARASFIGRVMADIDND